MKLYTGMNENIKLKLTVKLGELHKESCLGNNRERK